MVLEREAQVAGQRLAVRQQAFDRRGERPVGVGVGEGVDAALHGPHEFGSGRRCGGGQLVGVEGRPVGVADFDRVDDLLDQRACIPGHVDRQQRAHPLHQSICVRARGLVDIGDHARQLRAVGQQPRCGAQRSARRQMRGAVKCETARIGAPVRSKLGP